jgi:hypothetical protein
MKRDEARPEMPPGGQPRDGAFAPTRLVSTRPPVGTWLAVTVLAVAIAFVKPWETEPAPSPTGGAVAEGRANASAAVGTAPSQVQTLLPGSAGPLVAKFCLDPGSWRIATVERWRDQTIRVWRAIEPVDAASGPEDARIPIFPVVSEGITELGWCAPVTGPQRPVGHATIDAWRQTLSGWVAIRTTSTRPTGIGSSFGGLYAPPENADSEAPELWPDGDYVFRYREPTGRERWFGVEVELRPVPLPIRDQVRR